MLRKLVIAVVAALVAVPAASADKPDRSPADPFGDPVTLPAGVVCDFDLTVAEVVNNGTFTTFFDKQGVPRWTHGSGKLVWRYTNEGTGTSIDLNISGPGKTIEGDDGIVHVDGQDRGGSSSSPPTAASPATIPGRSAKHRGRSSSPGTCSSPSTPTRACSPS